MTHARTLWSASNSELRERIGIEVKHQDAPSFSASMRIAAEDLKLDRLVVLYPGDLSYPLSDRVEVVPLSALAAGDAKVLLGSGRHKE